MLGSYHWETYIAHDVITAAVGNLDSAIKSGEHSSVEEHSSMTLMSDFTSDANLRKLA